MMFIRAIRFYIGAIFFTIGIDIMEKEDVKDIIEQAAKEINKQLETESD